VVDPAPDPVDVRRARISTGVKIAKRVGYGLLAVAMVSFLVAAATGFPSGLLTVTVVTLVAACLVLPVPIVLGYGLRAAEREEREERQEREARGLRERRAGEEPPTTQR
jgi:hypothetical protein